MTYPSHGRVLVNSLAKSMGGKYSLYLIQILSMVVLARMFTPEQFGVFAVIQVFALFFALFSEVGLVPALVNEKHVSVRMRNGVFGFTIVLGFSAFILFLISSPLIALFYEYSAYQYLVIPVAISIIFNACSIVPIAAYSREKKFLHIARAEIIAEIGSLLFVIFTFMKLEAVLVLAIKPLVFSIFKFFLLWFGSKKTIIGKPNFSNEFGQVKPLYRFSVYQFMSNVMVYFSRNLDNLLVGKYFGVVSLGVYDKAYQLMRYPLMLLTFAMAPAIQPVLKELNEDVLKFTELHNKLVKYLAVVASFVGLGIYLSSELIVWVMLGEQWEMVGELLKILAVSIPIQVVLSSSGGFFQAANRTDLLFSATVFSTITNVTAICFAIYFGDLYVLCWAITISFTINFFQCYYLLGKNILKGFDLKLIGPLLLVLVSSASLALMNLFSI